MFSSTEASGQTIANTHQAADGQRTNLFTNHLNVGLQPPGQFRKLRMRGSQSRSAVQERGDAPPAAPLLGSPEPQKSRVGLVVQATCSLLVEHSTMSAAVGYGVPAGLDFYCGSVVVVGLWAGPCSWRTQRNDPVLTIVMNVVASDHSSFLDILAPYSEF